MRERKSIFCDDNGIWQLDESQRVNIPLDANAVLIARLDRLREEVRRVLQTAAVLGREFEITILSKMLKGDELVIAKVQEAEANTIWVALAEIRYIFRHALLREAAYQCYLPTI